MKKIFSAALAIVIVISAFTVCFGASAKEGKDPFNSADKNLITKYTAPTGHASFWDNSLNGASQAFDKDYSVNAATVGVDANGAATKTITWTVSDSNTEIKPNSADACRAFRLAAYGIGSKNISINGASDTEDAIYRVIQGYSVKDGEGATLNSFTIACPAGGQFRFDGYRPDGFTLFASDIGWDGCKNYNVYLTDGPTTTEYKKLITVTDLLKDGKWQLSKDGNFWFYEANFDAPVTAKYITIAFTQDDTKTISDNYKADPKIVNATNILISEFAVFADKITETQQTEDKPSDGTGDASMIIAVLAIGAVAAAGTAAAAKARRKEEI